MRNGNDHKPRANGVAISSPGEPAGSEASELYGEYETKLAHELTELLQAVPQSAARRDEAVRAAPQAATAAAARAPAGAVSVAFIPAARPYNDFVDDGSAPPISTAWRNEPEPEPAGIGHHLRYGAAGLATGLALVVPLVLVATGRLDLVTGGAPPEQRSAFVRSSTASAPAPSAVTALQGQEAGLPAAAGVRSATAPEPPRAATDAGAASRPADDVDALVTALPAGPPAQAVGSRTGEVPAATSAVPPAQMPSARPEPQSAPADPVAELMNSGLRHIGSGDIAAAREAFSRAASTGDPEATMALAETFDPNMLAAWGARDISADVGTARMLYGKALEAGVAKARMRIDALN